MQTAGRACMRMRALDAARPAYDHTCTALPTALPTVRLPPPRLSPGRRVHESARVRMRRNVGIDCVTSTATTVSLHWTGGSAIIPRRASCTKIDRAVNALPFPSECRLLVVLAREPARARLAPQHPLSGPRPAPARAPSSCSFLTVRFWTLTGKK
jgi:hypothetical protein